MVIYPNVLSLFTEINDFINLLLWRCPTVIDDCRMSLLSPLCWCILRCFFYFQILENGKLIGQRSNANHNKPHVRPAATQCAHDLSITSELDGISVHKIRRLFTADGRQTYKTAGTSSHAYRAPQITKSRENIS